MTAIDSIGAIDSTLKSKGYRYHRAPATYRGPLQVHGRTVEVEISISDTTFATLPTVRLIEAAALSGRPIAHLLNRQTICYTDESGLVLDLYEPAGAVLRVLAEAAISLERSFGADVKQEFERELAAYWGGKYLYSALPKKHDPTIICAEVLEFPNKAPSGLILATKGAWPGLASSRDPATVLTFNHPLRHCTEFPPKRLDEVIAYIGLQPKPPEGWEAAIVNATARQEDIFLIAPNAMVGWRPSFHGTLAAIKSKRKGFRAGFFSKAIAQRIKEITIDRQVMKESSLRFCVDRNLDGRPSLIDKHVAVVGCGAIGGYLAHLLVQSGAGCGGSITLYDPDILKPGNLGRHVLGFADLGKPKASALAKFVSAFHPDVNTHWHVGNAVSRWAHLSENDIIIDATGDANVATALNSLFLEATGTRRALALLHTWVFGNGVASQSFLNLGDGLACYRCLRTGFGGDWRYNPLRDRNSPLRQAPAQCGEGGYVPFPSDAPIVAASLAVRAATDWSGGDPGFRLRTTIVDPANGRDRLAWVSPPPLTTCSACGN